MADNEPRAVVVDHRGTEYQVHVAPRPGADDDTTPHLHVQALRGGAGRVLPLDHPFADELSRTHATIREIGGESKAARQRREELAAQEQDAQQREQRGSDAFTV